MAFVQNFEATQTLGEPSEIVLTDTSTGTDGNIVSRRVALQTADGDYLVPSGNDSDTYIVWLLADTSITLDVLSKDYGLYVIVQWLDASSAVLYEKIQLSGFTSYNEDGLYLFSQMEAANPLNTSDSNFLNNQFLARNYVDSGNQAIERYSDIKTAQICYDKATSIISNAQYLLNVNN